MNAFTITIIVIVGILIILIPLYYKTFDKIDLNILSSNWKLKKVLITIDKNSDFICIHNFKFKNKKNVVQIIPAIIISHQQIYLFFRIGNRINIKDSILFETISDDLNKKITFSTNQIILLTKSLISLNKTLSLKDYPFINNWNAQKILDLVKLLDLKSGQNILTIQEKQNIIKILK